MQHWLDEGDVPSLHKAARLCVSDSVRFALLPIAAHLPFPGCCVELSRVLDVREDSGANDAKVRELNFLAVKHLQWRLHLKRLFQSPVFKVHRRHKQPPHMNDGKLLSASMHRTMAHRVLPTRSDTPIYCGMLVAVNSWIIPLSKQYFRNSSPGVPATLVGTPMNDAAAEGDDRGTVKQLM